ncbi:hypothetical protein JDV02_010674 [Purpureocillium takamizusanense]|uniref:Uncharacterized protein n=1 Tax=Purpureocillium takamizusanense TaxID=2060973 RepID=A0A9Q8QU89_9HYPO|nr:uncharacterized protein JDV02_010674 [Purpureocillium takamizusanense]UNI24961.1 hypothetical protein JDV02_010674 [Purpureocillium takamizusanense]
MRSVIALAYTLLAAVLVAAVPFSGPDTLGLVVRDCECPDDSGEDGSCTCADPASPPQRLQIDTAKLDCKACMDSGKPCACAPPDARLFHCLCTGGRADGLAEPCACGVAGRGLLNDLLHEPADKMAGAENANDDGTKPKPLLCGGDFKLGKTSSCAGNHSSSSFDRKRNASSRWGLIGKLLSSVGGVSDSSKADGDKTPPATDTNCGKSLRLWEASTCVGSQDQARFQCMCQENGVNGKTRPCPCNGPDGNHLTFLGNRV